MPHACSCWQGALIEYLDSVTTSVEFGVLLGVQKKGPEVNVKKLNGCNRTTCKGPALVSQPRLKCIGSTNTSCKIVRSRDQVDVSHPCFHQVDLQERFGDGAADTCFVVQELLCARRAGLLHCAGDLSPTSLVQFCSPAHPITIISSEPCRCTTMARTAR